MIDTELGYMVCDDCDDVLRYNYYTVEELGEDYHYCRECAIENAEALLEEGKSVTIYAHDDADNQVDNAIEREREYRYERHY